MLAYCCSRGLLLASVVGQAHCCSVVIVNNKNSVQLPTFGSSSLAHASQRSEVLLQRRAASQCHRVRARARRGSAWSPRCSRTSPPSSACSSSSFSTSAPPLRGSISVFQQVGSSRGGLREQGGPVQTSTAVAASSAGQLGRSSSGHRTRPVTIGNITSACDRVERPWSCPGASRRDPRWATPAPSCW